MLSWETGPGLHISIRVQCKTITLIFKSSPTNCNYVTYMYISLGTFTCGGSGGGGGGSSGSGAGGGSSSGGGGGGGGGIAATTMRGQAGWFCS